MIKEATVRRPQRKNPDSSSGTITLYSMEGELAEHSRYHNRIQRKETLEDWKTINKNGYYQISPDIND